MIWSFIQKQLLCHSESKLSDANQTIEYRELLERAIVTGEHLREKLSEHAKCIILCKSDLNNAAALVACWCANLVPIPAAVNYGERHYQKILDLVKPDLIITDSEDINIKGMNIFQISVNRYIRFENSGLKQNENLKDAAVILCTSGTTGQPKGAVITKEGLIKNILHISEYLQTDSSDRIMIIRPLYHCAVLTGEFLLSLYKGTDIVFEGQKYNPLSVIGLIEKYNITVLGGTPTLFHHLTIGYHRLKKKSPLQTVVVSGECMTKKQAEKIRSCFKDTKIYSVYGLTEAAPRVSYLPPHLFDTHPESVGAALNETEIRIVESFENLDCLPALETGLVVVKSPSIMKGYYNDEELTRKVLHKGWLNTGDIGYMDQNGLLYICSRADDMMIKAGMNIYPKEIETAIRTIPIVEDAVAYGVKDGDGITIGVNIKLDRNSHDINTDKKTLMALFSGVLPEYQMPGIINIVEELEKTVSGKTIRPKLL